MKTIYSRYIGFIGLASVLSSFTENITFQDSKFYVSNKFLYSSGPPAKRKKKPLTAKQIKRRKKEKRAKLARRINRGKKHPKDYLF